MASLSNAMYFSGLISSDDVINPLQEVLAYETLWATFEQPSFKKISGFLNSRRPSSVKGSLPPKSLEEVSDYIINTVKISSFNILMKWTPGYPGKLLKLENDLPFLYYKGDVSLIDGPSVSIVGARDASDRGKSAAEMITEGLVKLNYIIISGLADGVDTVAHKTAIAAGGKTIGVIGTPLTENYPKFNKNLQDEISKNHLLISHVPFVKYHQQDWRLNRFFFPERNKTMAALSEATVIIEASDKSGTLTQARACFKLGKKLIILKPTYDNPSLTWPRKFVKEGAFVAENFGEIKAILAE